MKVVLDTNILLQALGKSSRFRTIWQTYVEEKFVLIVSNSILLEYEEIIIEKTTESIGENVVSLIGEAANTEHVAIFYEWDAIKRDSDDNKYFDAAVSGNADFIVTNDKHFDDIKELKFPKVVVISGERFLEIVNGL